MSIRAVLRSLDAEAWFVIALALSSFIGVWYALPMLNVIGDVSGFSGSVLRSMEAHSLLPGVLAYGTVTFYFCYAATAAFLALAFPFYHFSIDALRIGLFEHPEQVYWVARAVSAGFVAWLVFSIHSFLKEEVPYVWYRTAILLSTFGSILVTMISRTGKVWVIASVLGTFAILLCYKSVRDEAFPGKKAFLSIMSAAVAAANFPLAALYGMVVFFLVYFFRAVPGAWKRLAQYAFCAGAVFAGIIALNYKNVYLQVLEIFSGYHPLASTDHSIVLVQLPFLPSLVIHLLQILEVYPFILFLGGYALLSRGIANKQLFSIGAISALVYIAAISFVANWYIDTGTYMRYLYPLGFMSIFILASLKPPHRAISISMIIINVCIYVHTLALLSFPATYNVAVDVIIERFGEQKVVLENYIFELDLPMNTQSYALLNTLNCASKCQYAIAHDRQIPFMPIVQTIYSASATSTFDRYLVVEVPLSTCGDPVFTVPSGTETSRYVDIEYVLGNYFDPAFYTATHMGKHVFVYDRAFCPNLIAPERSSRKGMIYAI